MVYREKELALKMIKNFDTNNPFEIAKRLNIHVFYHDLHEECMGFYKLSKKNKFICINNNLNQEEKHVTCSHELGHALQHPKVNTPFLKKNTFLSISKFEREANLFAIELMIPDKEWYSLTKNFQSFNIMSQETGIPEELLILKHMKLNS